MRTYRNSNKRKRISGIYSITNTITGRVYIGKSVNIPDRWWSHLASEHNKELKDDFNTYGIGSFTFRILALAPKSRLDSLEREYISEYSSQYSLYNIKLVNN